MGSANTTALQPRQGDALIVVDVQRDFLAGGALAVPRGGEVLKPLNQYVELFAALGLPIFATRDWHPANHSSFADQGGPWPAHCVMNTPGAEFAAELRLPKNVQVVSKATRPDREAYSDFDEPGLDARLKEQGVGRLFVGGLATEYCVLATVRDALVRRYQVVLLADAVRPLDVEPGDGQRAEQEMIRLGAKRGTWDSIGARALTSRHRAP